VAGVSAWAAADPVSDHIQALDTEISAMEIEARELDEEIEGLQE